MLRVQDHSGLISESVWARLVTKQDSLSATTIMFLFVCFKEALVERNHEEERAGERGENTQTGDRKVFPKSVCHCLGTI